MAGLLFVAQTMLDSWAEQGKIDFVGNVMTLLAGDGKGRSYALDPAVRFMKVLGADTDPNQLLRKVKSQAQLRELGAEAVDASVILGDVAYEVEPGFLAEMSALQAVATAKPDPTRTMTPAPQPAVSAAIAAAAAAQAHPAAATAQPAAATAQPAAARPPANAAPPASPAPAQVAPPASRAYASAPLPKELEERRKEAEALARFLLDNLS